MFKQDTTLALYNGFGQAGCTQEEQHPERMIEGNLFVGQLCCTGWYISPGHGIAVSCYIDLAESVGNHDGFLQGGQCFLKFVDGGAPVDDFAAVLVAIDGKQDGGFDLLETVDDAARAEIGRTT